MAKDVAANREGQMILLSGFVIVLSLLLITILLNDVILMSNVAGSGLTPGKQDFKALHEMTICEARNAVSKANKSDSALFNLTFSSYFYSYANATASLYAANGEAVEIRLDYINRTGVSADYLNITLSYSDSATKLEEKIHVKI